MTVKTKSTQTENSSVVEPSEDESLESDSNSDSDSYSGYSLLRLYRLFVPFNQDDYNYGRYIQSSATAKTYAAEPQKVAESKAAESTQSQQENQGYRPKSM